MSPSLPGDFPLANVCITFLHSLREIDQVILVLLIILRFVKPFSFISS